MLMSALDLLHRDPDPDRERIREELSGNICRCTGYMASSTRLKPRPDA
jgi:carbon-monoxide dehydrogenase small subunit